MRCGPTAFVWLVVDRFVGVRGGYYCHGSRVAPSGASKGVRDLKLDRFPMARARSRPARCAPARDTARRRARV